MPMRWGAIEDHFSLPLNRFYFLEPLFLVECQHTGHPQWLTPHTHTQCVVVVCVCIEREREETEKKAKINDTREPQPRGGVARWMGLTVAERIHHPIFSFFFPPLTTIYYRPSSWQPFHHTHTPAFLPTPLTRNRRKNVTILSSSTG